MEKISISVPSSLYCAIFERHGESTSQAILDLLNTLASPEPELPNVEIHDYPRPGNGTITGKIWDIADKYSSSEHRVSRHKVIDACLKEGINVNTANTQYSHWSKAPLQGGGVLRAWQSSDRTFHHLFLTLDLQCKPDHYPGVVIISNKEHSQVMVKEVDNLEKELPQLLGEFEGTPEIYWDLETDEGKRGEIVNALTENPVFVG